MLEIRAYRASDEPQLHALDEEIQREYRGAAWDGFSLAKRQEMLWYPHRLAKDLDLDFLLVVVEGDQLAGFLFAYRESIRRDRLRIDGVAVQREYRRAGLAARLYSELLLRAEHAGVTTLITRISLDNEPSQRLHASSGFELGECVEAVLNLGSTQSTNP